MLTKTVLVTGGAGYIGSHTCKALHQAGYLPVTYDNLSRGHRWAVKWGPIEEGDIFDREKLNEILFRYKPEAILHFAALAYVGESMQEPAKYYRNNVVGSLTLLEAAQDHKINKFVFSSTCATYGIPEKLPISEDHPQLPVNPYGASKLMIERMLADFDTAYGLKYISLRYFNAAGADPDGDIGEVHEPETHIIPLVLNAARDKEKSITIYGTDYDTPDGSCIRDYIHVTDLAAAHVLALQALENQNTSQVYNLGYGNGISVKEVIDKAENVTGKHIHTIEGARRPGDPAILVANSNRIKTELGWLPRYAGIDSIINSAWNWELMRIKTSYCKQD